MPSNPELLAFCRLIRKRMAEGKVIPFLGAGANMCGGSAHPDWVRHRLPNGTELAEHLAREFEFPPSEPRDLVRVGQYVAMKVGEQVLFDELHKLFAGDYAPNGLHRLLAGLPAELASNGGLQRKPLIITTNYDDALEQAFVAAGEEFDVVYYAVEPGKPGRFRHVRPDGSASWITRHTDYHDFAPSERSVILKIHGAIDRADETADSFVITEDHYIEFLSRTNVSKVLPAQLMARMKTSHFLFLGYGMRDWNLRVILHHVWSQRARPYVSWAIQRKPNPIDLLFWQRHSVELVGADLDEWVDGMRASGA